MGVVREYMVDVVDPDESFSLEDWLSGVHEILGENKGEQAIIVGGTGLYISALVENYDLPGTFDEKLRAKLEKDLAGRGANYLLRKMKKIDPNIENKIDTKNPRRVVRAAEIIFQTGKPFERGKGESPYEFLQIGVNRPREELYEKIDRRVDIMMEQGLVQEVKSLLDHGYDEKLPAMSGIGYRQIVQFLKNEISGQEAVRLIKRDTRRYAKRQMTWFKRDKNIRWVRSAEEAVREVEAFLGYRNSKSKTQNLSAKGRMRPFRQRTNCLWHVAQK